MPFSLLDIVQLLAAYHCAGLTLALIGRRALVGLAVLCLTFCLHMLFNLGVAKGVVGPAFDITSAFGLVYGPAFYLFVRGMVAETPTNGRIALLHAIPALIIATWQPEPPIPYLFGLPSLVIYIGLSLRELRRHKALSAQLRSDDGAISLRWVEQALMVFAALAALDISREIIGYTSRAIPDDYALAFVIASVVTLLTGMTLAARRHTERQGALPAIDLTETDSADGSEHPVEEFERIRSWLETEEAWREPRLALADIARALRLNPRDVSRAINLHAGESFSRHINAYRVQALDALMADPDNHGRTVIELAYEVGFNSKSAFNRTYRELTGLTPTEAFARARSGARSGERQAKSG